MKSLQRQQSTSPLQSQLDEYLNLKPHRAVQRLLQQNDLQQCFQIYNLLQQNVKTNTNQLRSVLYSKHENLHQCSQMIQQIQDFAMKVKNIQTSIDDLMKTDTIEEDWGLDNGNLDKNPVAKIQDLMNDHKFTQALKQCGKYVKNDFLLLIEQQSEIYYINFLKVQIVQKLQEYLENTPLTSELIQQAISALREFMSISTIEDLYEYIQQSAPSQSQQILNTNDESRTLLGLIYQKYVEREQGQSQRKYPLEQGEIVEVIFKFKLLTLKKSTESDSLHSQRLKETERVDFLYSKVFHYFSDLLKILEQVSSKTQKKFYQIFRNNIPKTIEQISQIFITDQRKENLQGKQAQNIPTISFENQLYQKLIDSKEFIDVINTLESHLEKSQEINKTEEKSYQILGLIKNLWRDFYHQMLDIITEKINPCNYLKFEHSFNAQPMEQFLRFSVLPFQKVTNQKIQTYEKQLNLFFNNFIELLNKSKSNQQKSAIIQYFLQLKRKTDHQSKEQVVKLNTEIKEQKNKKTFKKQQQLKIRQIIVLFFITESYNNSWSVNFQEDSQLFKLLKDSNYVEQNIFHIYTFSLEKNINSPEFKQFYQIIDSFINSQISYRHLSGSEYIESWQQQFDLIFGSYNLIVKQNERLKLNLKNLILALIKTKLQELQKS